MQNENKYDMIIERVKSQLDSIKRKPADENQMINIRKRFLG